MTFKNSYNRRQFTKQTGLVMFATLLDSHFLLSNPLKSPKETFELIKEIRLLSSIEISQLVHFYGQILGFEIIDQTSSYCTFQAGSSLLTFTKTDKKNAPFYHFAFNIPENKIKKAEKWQQAKTEFIKPPRHLTDRSMYSDNIVHFRHWDAHSLFFYDPAGNVVEYIARHTLNNKIEGDFTQDDVLCISEIGLVVEDVKHTSDIVAQQFGFKQYKGASEDFSALGDENGLIIFFRQNTKEAFQKGKSRQVFGTQMSLNLKSKSSNWQIPRYPYIIEKINNQ